MMLTGCSAESWTWTPRADNARTVTARAGRDTDAARSENEAGLALLAKGELDKARDAFLRALAADAEFGPAQNNFGKVCLMQGDLHEAARRFGEARRLMPTQAGPSNNLGLVYEEAWRKKTSLASGAGAPADGRRELGRAVEQYREAIRIDPDGVEYRANLARALINRGDHSDEVRSLLKQVLDHDTRPQWQSWARRQLAIIGQKSD